jgi:hypothetical protein
LWAILGFAITQSDAVPGEVIINSNNTFDESVYISESVTLRAGTGFSPIIEKTSGWTAPIRIRATQDSFTVVVLRGITVRTQASGEFDGITISNVSTTHTLDVTVDNVTVDAKESQSAISVASASINADISLTVTNSLIQIEGEPAGSPECLRLDPYAYNLTTVLRNNTFRFSRAGGVSIQGGRDDVWVVTYIDANVFEGFTSASGDGRRGVGISGTGTSGSNASPTLTYITNNLFLLASPAVYVNGQQQHTHTAVINNNTVVGSGWNGLYFVAFGTSTVQAYAANNIVVGSAGFGIFRQESSSSVVNLINNFNLLFANTAGNYSGATPGADSLAVDPQFKDTNMGNYRLRFSSPAIDSGTNTPPGGLGFGEDLDGGPRVKDGDGNGSAVCDMGAYEASPVCTKPTLQSLWGEPPTYQWDCGGGGWEWFWVYVLNLSTGAYYGSDWVNSSTNTWTPTYTLPWGSYRAWVRVYDSGYGFSEWSDPKDFTVGNCTGKPSFKETPVGDQPTYRWSGGGGEWTWFWVYVQNLSTGAYYGTGSASHGWVNSSKAFWDSAYSLPWGNYRTWVRVYHENCGFSEWSDPVDWTVGNCCAKAVLQTPSGGRPTYQWSCGTGAWTWFWVYVQNLSTGAYYGTGSASHGWVNSSVNTWASIYTLPAGDYRAWVRVYHENCGFSEWSDPVDWTVWAVVPM